MRKFEISDKLKKDLVKISKKDPNKYHFFMKKLKEIISTKNINHYKNLRKPLSHLKRVHINNSFVLTFEYKEQEDLVRFIEIDHHDNIYK
jgi:YafQ family addiction module toxin component